MQPTNTRPDRPSAMKRFGPLVAILVAVVLILVVVVVAGGGKEDNSKDKATGENATTEELVRSGPMTTEKAKLLNQEVDFGDKCDEETGLYAIPFTYSSLCVEPFTGNNGGATAPGVTAKEVKVIVYVGDPRKNPLQAATVRSAGADVDVATAKETMTGYAQLFSAYYETYGRTVNVEYFNGTGAPDDPITAKADAIAIAEQKPFAVINGPPQTNAFSEEITARGILCIGDCALAKPEKFTTDHAPLVWATGPIPEQASLLTAEMVGNMLAGKKAEFAGDPKMQSQIRKFGAVHYNTPAGDHTAAFGALADALAKNGAKLVAEQEFFLDLARSQEIARTVIAKMKTAGVTTIIFYGDPIMPGALSREATAQDYFPEWVLGPNVLADIALFGRTYDQKQWAHAFGVALTPARTNQSASQTYNLYKWFHGQAPPNNTYGVLIPGIGNLFHGINMAGPKLTANSFRDGMFRSPSSGGTPLSPAVSRGHHGIWPGTDWGGSDDTGLLWWNPNAVGEDEVGNVGKGLYEYVLGGQRYEYGKVPSSDPGFFDAKSSITIYEEIPPEYAPPSYPSPAKN